MKKVAIVVGHTKLRPGACGVDGIECEFDYNKKVAEYLSDVADVYYYDSYNLGYRKMVQKNATKMNLKNYNIVLELHYNAATPQANGCEIFHYFTNKKGKKYAEYLSRLISSTFKVKDRGAKAMVNKKQRGFWALYYPKATTLLLEPFFGSNSDDVSKFCNNEKKYAGCIRTFLKNNNLI